MAKRKQLDYDGEALAQNLRQSTGHGVDAFFARPVAPSPGAETPAGPSAPEAVAPLPHRSLEETRIDAPMRARVHAPVEDELRRAVAAKSRLSSFTFRFHSDELARLDHLVAALVDGNGQQPSKNDVVRLALDWLLQDYETNREQSVAARVLGRI